MKSFLKVLKKYWINWLLTGFLIVLFGYLALGGFQNWFSLKKEIRDMETEIQEITEETGKLSTELEQTTSVAHLEKQARTKLNLKGEGEEVFVVLGLENIEKEENFSNMFNEPVEGSSELWLNIKSWWNYFFNSD